MNDLEKLVTRNETYRDFSDHKIHFEPGKSQEFKVFVHGASKRGAKILKLLVSYSRTQWRFLLTRFQEEGVFDALDGRVLQTVQFFITSNIPESGTVHEAYTLKFRYIEDDLTKISFKDAEQSFLTQNQMLASCKSFKGVIRVLLRGFRTLGDISGPSSWHRVVTPRLQNCC